MAQGFGYLGSGNMRIHRQSPRGGFFHFLEVQGKNTGRVHIMERKAGGSGTDFCACKGVRVEEVGLGRECRMHGDLRVLVPSGAGAARKTTQRSYRVPERLIALIFRWGALLVLIYTSIWTVTWFDGIS